MRIGHSIDAHSFVSDNTQRLILGGVKIDHIGLKGHSDADILLHVVAESILGALALGDLGTLFPDTHEKYKNINSNFFVEKAIELAAAKKYQVENIDCMVCAEKPRLNQYIKLFRENISQLLKVNVDFVSVKATTFEKMGFIGKEEGILATATILLKEIKE